MNRKLWTLFIQRHLQNKPKIYFWLKITPLLIFYPFTLMSLDTHRIWQINNTWNRATVSTTYWSLCASSFLPWILVFLVSFSNFSQTLSMLWNNCNFSDCWKFVTQMSIDWIMLICGLNFDDSIIKSKSIFCCHIILGLKLSMKLS